jgi:hypothetical protein
MEREFKKSAGKRVPGSACVPRGREGVEKREGTAAIVGAEGGIPKELTAEEDILSAIVPSVR